MVPYIVVLNGGSSLLSFFETAVIFWNGGCEGTAISYSGIGINLQNFKIDIYIYICKFVK
jgi:hypothetical protein